MSGQPTWTREAPKEDGWYWATMRDGETEVVFLRGGSPYRTGEYNSSLAEIDWWWPVKLEPPK